MPKYVQCAKQQVLLQRFTNIFLNVSKFRFPLFNVPSAKKRIKRIQSHSSLMAFHPTSRQADMQQGSANDKTLHVRSSLRD